MLGLSLRGSGDDGASSWAAPQYGHSVVPLSSDRQHDSHGWLPGTSGSTRDKLRVARSGVVMYSTCRLGLKDAASAAFWDPERGSRRLVGVGPFSMCCRVADTTRRPLLPRTVVRVAGGGGTP